jgi:hypothetical protein
VAAKTNAAAPMRRSFDRLGLFEIRSPAEF